MWVQNGGFKCNLSNSMGSTGSEGSLGHLTPIQRVLWDLWDPCFSSRGFHFPRIFHSPKHPREERTSCMISLLVVDQLLEQLTSDPEALGSIPGRVS